jgi:hypothetical protein
LRAVIKCPPFRREAQEGRTCRQLLFDNQSGRFSDNGYVDCVNAAYRSPGEPKFWSAARARVISNSFRND